MTEEIKVELTIKGEIEKLHVGVDDLLVVHLHGVNSQEQFAAIKAGLDHVMEGLGLKGRYVAVAEQLVSMSVVEGIRSQLALQVTEEITRQLRLRSSLS